MAEKVAKKLVKGKVKSMHEELLTRSNDPFELGGIKKAMSLASKMTKVMQTRLSTMVLDSFSEVDVKPPIAKPAPFD